MLPRVYQNRALAVGEQIALDKSASHHLLTVLKRQLDSPMVVFNGQGGEYHGKIVAIHRHQATILLTQFDNKNVESPLHIHLAQVISRGEKMDLTLQKAVELGVTSITPLISKRCGVKLPAQRWEKKIGHWRNIIISACEQCGRNTLPTLAEPIALDRWLGNVKEKTRLVLAPQVGQSLTSLGNLQGEIVILIGPEGGLSEEEQQFATRQQFTPLTLGPRILRTETAGVVMLSILQALGGDLSG